VLKGRLGLDSAKIPHADRSGLLYLARGALTARDGTLSFRRGPRGDADPDPLADGEYAIPTQTVSMILLGPGSTVSHDALRLLAHARTALAAVGEDGVRLYTAPPLIPDRSGLARLQARLWADDDIRIMLARRMYAWRLGEVLPHRSLDVLRGIEGARMKETYRLTAEKIGVTWRGRRYDRGNPGSADLPNQALNHAASAIEAAAAIAVSATATIPQLGFIHEDPGQSFVLDVADLFRDTVTIPCAFRAAKAAAARPDMPVERLARRMTGGAIASEQVIPKMIERIKALIAEPDAVEGRKTRDAGAAGQRGD
jgi:CRISPR-associated protein Cas1